MICATAMQRKCSETAVHPKVAQERLGHSTIATTMDLYSHVSDTMQADAASRLDAAFQVAKSGREGQK
jgi:integrase